MNSNYGIFKPLGWVLVFHFALISQASANMCKILETTYETIDHLTCCEGNAFEITPLKHTPGWTECAGQEKDDNENYTTTVWRMYTCALGKLLPKDQKTISLKEFAELRISNFTDSVQKRIVDKIKEDGKKDTKKPWLSSDVQLTDYSYIDKLRKHYFNIEKDICGYNETSEEKEDEKRSSCNFVAEFRHRGGDCCGNISLPICTIKFGHNMVSNCNRTLKTLYDKIAFKNQTRRNTGILDFTCEDSCYLIQKKLLTIDKLIKVQVNDTIETDDIVKDQMPTFYSKKVLRSAQDYVKKQLNTTKVLEWVKEDWADKLDNPTELYGCALYQMVLMLASVSPKSSCFEEKSLNSM